MYNKQLLYAGDIMMDIISFIRSIRTQHNLDKKDELRLFIEPKEIDSKIAPTSLYLCMIESLIMKLGNISEIEYDIHTLLKDNNHFEHINIDGFNIYIELPSIDKNIQEKSIDIEIARLEKQILSLNGKLLNEEFLNKAPKEIIEKEKEKLDYLTNKIESLKSLNLYRKCGLIYYELINRLGIEMIQNFIEYEEYSEITPDSINNLHRKIYTSQYELSNNELWEN